MIVGTSTGGILGCFYLTPNPNQKLGEPSSKFTAAQALAFYDQKGYFIFNGSKRKSWGGLRQLFNATKHKSENLEQIFNEEFADLKMHQLLKRCLVPTYNLKSKAPFFFSSREFDDKQREFYVKDVVRSTSAAPTYFTPTKINNLKTGKQMINIDGGVFANNPAMCAYAESRKSIFEEQQIEYPSAKDMLILSIGTGGGQFDLPNLEKTHKWGVISWAKSAPEIMMDAAFDTVDYHMKNLFSTLDKQYKLNYKRIDVPFDKRDYARNMADASKKILQL